MRSATARLATGLAVALGLVAWLAAAAGAAPPTVALAPYVPQSGSSVKLVGYVNPKGEATSYAFQYGLRACSQGGCQSVPAGEGAAGGGASPRRVEFTVTGLAPGGTYRYRLRATNGSGSMASEEAYFALPKPVATESPACANEAWRQRAGQARLPECRAWELVSRFDPVARNGLDVSASTQLTQAAEDGDALAFASTTASDEAASLPAMTQYMAVRGESGWAVHGITPAQETLEVTELLGGGPGYRSTMSADLKTGVFLSNRLLGGGGENVAGLMNLYLRDDLLTPGPGRYRLLSDSGAPQLPSPLTQPAIAATSADFSHVLFESELALVPEAEALPEGPKLYKWSPAAGERLVGVLPDAQGGGPTLARAGAGARNPELFLTSRNGFTERTMSRDGSRVLFTAPPFEDPTGGGETAGSLYLHDDQGTLSSADDTSVSVSASEKTNGGGLGGADPAGSRPALFWDATPDLGQVFFTSREALTDDAASAEPELPKLYRWDLSAPAGHRLTLLSVDREPADGLDDAADGVIGVSDDGAYVYFVGPSQLQAGGPTDPAKRIFVWHEGKVREVGAINGGEELNRVLGTAWARWDSALGAVIGIPKWSRLSADGLHLEFVSEGSAELGGYDHGTACGGGAGNGCTEVYDFRASGSGPGRLQCASCSPTGFAATGDADFFAGGSLLLGVGANLNRSQVSAGRLILFDTTERLVSEDRNGEADVYAFDTVTGFVRLISSGAGDDGSYFMDASSDGKDVFFITRQKLSAADGDEHADVYDARVGGGMEDEPPPASAQPCASNEACRSVSEAVPSPAVATGESRATERRREAKRRRLQAKRRQQRAMRRRRAARRRRQRARRGHRVHRRPGARTARERRGRDRGNG